ncbi:hypothetical protein LIER_13430 [Lithospermum erythrorhizon]|uniref:H15 domain-containing protein n=1 Tax=Lithospermum erythrorhizon TaxID=34254 RepID=A0AAV3PVE0_LITER
MEPTKPSLETPSPHKESDNVVPKFIISDNFQRDRNGFQSDEPRTSCALDNFKKLVMHVASACTKTNNKPFSSTQTSLVEQHLDELFPCLSTPDHPPYAAMIQEAIEQLNEKEGSGKELISTFIKKNSKDLPWDHDGMLEHHLNLLCKKGDVVQTKDGNYVVSNGANERNDGPSCSVVSAPDTGLSVGNSQIVALDRHTEATTENPGRKHIRKCKQGANAEEIRPIQTPITGRGSGKQRGMIRKNLIFEETNPISEDLAANNETTGKFHQVQEVVESNLQDIPLEVQIATCGQNLHDKVSKRGRGRPPKTEKKDQLKPPGKNDASKKKSRLQDPNEEGKEIKNKRVRKPTPVPGRKRGRPPKNDTARQLQIIQEQLKTMQLENISGQTVEEEKDSRNIGVRGN